MGKKKPQPTTAQKPTGELTDNTLKNVAGGQRPGVDPLNPQPLPPRKHPGVTRQ